MLHLSGLLFIVALILNFTVGTTAMFTFAVVAFLLTVYFGYQYVKWNFGMEPTDKFFVWCKMKYLTNLSFIQGGLKDFKKYKVLCIEPSF